VLVYTTVNLTISSNWYVKLRDKCGVKLLFQASAAVSMKSSLFWDVTQRRLVVCYGRFGTTYRSHLPRVEQSKKFYSLTCSRR
jgi:hypothetical protein